MGVPVRGAIDVGGAVAKLQQLTVKQELHHVQKVHRPKVCVGAREDNRGTKKACLNKSSAGHIRAESDASVRDKVGRVGEAGSGPFKRGTGKTERATAQARPPVLEPGA